MSVYENVDVLNGLDNFNPRSKANQSKVSELTRRATYVESPKALLELEEELATCDINQTDIYGRTALHWLIGYQYLPGYKNLVEKGADVNKPTCNEGLTPLMVSCRAGSSVQSAIYLLDFKADHSVKAKNSATAFHIAVATSNRDIMRLLILNGADPFVPLKDGRTALDLAMNDHMKSLVYSCYRSAIIREEKYKDVCANCKASDVKLDRCGKCYVTFYCSRDCQQTHWKKEHKDTCQGSVTATILNCQPKTYVKTKKGPTPAKNKTFVVEVTGNPTRGFVIKSNEKNIEAEIKDIDGIKKKLNTYEHSNAFFWAEFIDSSKKDLRLYHGKILPRPSSGAYR